MWERIAKANRAKPRPQEVAVQYGPWPYGMDLENSSNMVGNPISNRISVTPNDLIYAYDVFYKDGGVPYSRNGTDELIPIEYGATTAINETVTFIEDINSGGSWLLLVAASSTNLLYRQRLSGTTESLQKVMPYGSTASFSSASSLRFKQFGNKVYFFDGSYLKYINVDGVDGLKNGAAYPTVIPHLVYDDGTGSTSYQYNYRDDQEFSFVTIGNGTNEYASQLFDTSAWDTGYTIPPTVAFVKMYTSGTGFTGIDNVGITARVQYATSAGIPKPWSDTVYSSATLVARIQDIPTTPTEYSVVLTTTTELAPSQTDRYYLSFEYDNGDATNFVKISTSSKTGVDCHASTASGTSAISNQALISSLRPGLPPKAVEGVIHNQRLFLIEGESGDNPDYIWYSNASDPFDWSTPNGGGYLQIGTTIGAIVPFYRDLWIFGIENKPGLNRLAGTTPTTWAVESVSKRTHAHYKGVYAASNDIFFINSYGLFSLRTVQEYGDVKTASLSRKVMTELNYYFDGDDYHIGYDPFNDVFMYFDISSNKMFAFSVGAISTSADGAFAPCSFINANMQSRVYNSGINKILKYFTTTDTGRLLFANLTGEIFEQNIRTPTLGYTGGSHTINVSPRVITGFMTSVVGDLEAYKFQTNSYVDNFNNPSSSTMTIGFDRNLTGLEVVSKSLVFPPNPGGDNAAYYDRQNINFNFRNLSLDMTIASSSTASMVRFNFLPVNVFCRKVRGL